MGPYTPRVRRDLDVGPGANSLSVRAPWAPANHLSAQRGWGFHTVRGGTDPGYLRFRPRVVGDVEIWKDLWSGDGTLSSPWRRFFVSEHGRR